MVGVRFTETDARPAFHERPNRQCVLRQHQGVSVGPLRQEPHLTVDDARKLIHGPGFQGLICIEKIMVGGTLVPLRASIKE